MPKAMSFKDAAIAFFNGNDYRIHFWYMSKGGVINLLEMLICLWKKSNII